MSTYVYDVDVESEWIVICGMGGTSKPGRQIWLNDVNHIHNKLYASKKKACKQLNNIKCVSHVLLASSFNNGFI